MPTIWRLDECLSYPTQLPTPAIKVKGKMVNKLCTWGDNASLSSWSVRQSPSNRFKDNTNIAVSYSHIFLTPYHDHIPSDPHIVRGGRRLQPLQRTFVLGSSRTSGASSFRRPTTPSTPLEAERNPCPRTALVVGHVDCTDGEKWKGEVFVSSCCCCSSRSDFERLSV